MENSEVLLERNMLQKDLRIRLPKQILTNLDIVVGEELDIYIDTLKQEIIIRKSKSNSNDALEA
ncbi:AbrB/MazE/SpoVT family DNA-binding domain-containing protein [Ruminococcus flavefaciens]|uniref:AbrB/MazE/SpoVT family DNA-binding domain-containing protein n=1 Tax=Ruminococcus flavefaciens TaxID=1265 RepID=UPI000490853C|nr:hypothetical protein [Ruminococcus flavefaciens]